MYYYIKMPAKKMALQVSLPLLPGSVSTAQSACGKPNCACKEDPPKLHGTYYRWTGIISETNPPLPRPTEEGGTPDSTISQKGALE
jgi:hypothetical protein